MQLFVGKNNESAASTKYSVCTALETVETGPQNSEMQAVGWALLFLPLQKQVKYLN